MCVRLLHANGEVSVKFICKSNNLLFKQIIRKLSDSVKKNSADNSMTLIKIFVCIVQSYDLT